MKMKKRQLSVTWGLLASAGIFFILGKFIAPEYETKLLEFGIFEEVFPVSKYSLVLSGVLVGLFVIFLLIRLIRGRG
jgi:Ca2+/H+ antiporter